MENPTDESTMEQMRLKNDMELVVEDMIMSDGTDAVGSRREARS